MHSIVELMHAAVKNHHAYVMWHNNNRQQHEKLQLLELVCQLNQLSSYLPIDNQNALHKNRAAFGFVVVAAVIITAEFNTYFLCL